MSKTIPPEQHPLQTFYGRRPKYQVLRELLPLDTPLSVQVDPSNVCNFKCIFCPTGDIDLLRSVDRPKGHMRLSLFKKIVDDLTGFPRQIRKLLLYKDGEPLANKELPNMVAYAKARKVADIVAMTSNASLLTRERADALIDAGLDEICVSVYGLDAESYKRTTQTFSAYSRIQENVGYLYAEKMKRRSNLHIHSKIVDTDLTEQQKVKFISDFSQVSDSINIHPIMGWSNTFDRDMTLGLMPSTGPSGSALNQNRRVCPSPFKTMAINFNGKVSVCCVDWSLGTVVGDSSIENVVDIWNGSQMKEFRMLHLNGQRERIEACSKCQYVQGVAEIDDLDVDAKQLMRVYSKLPYE